MTAGPLSFIRQVAASHRAVVQILPEPFRAFFHRIDEEYSVHLHRVHLFHIDMLTLFIIKPI